MKFRSAVLVAVLCALLAPVMASAKNMKPGKWQLTVQTEMPNAPVTPPPMSFTRCITKEDAESNEPPKMGRDNDCKVTDMKVDGNTVHWKVTCEKRGATGEGTVTYSGEAYSGTMTLSLSGMDMTTKFSGKYLGECDK